VTRAGVELSRLVPWCSGLTCVPVKDETAGSNPVGTAGLVFTVLLDCMLMRGVWEGSRAYATRRVDNDLGASMRRSLQESGG